MGLFARKPNPVIETQGLQVEYHTKQDWWTFKDGGAEFLSYGPTLVFPTLEQLASIQRDIKELRSEMVSRIAAANAPMNDGEAYSVNLTKLSSEGTFEVAWAGGRLWGDIRVDFTIKDHQIAAESWWD